jgi:hypothetical protein
MRVSLKSLPRFERNFLDVRHVLKGAHIINKKFRKIDKNEFLSFDEEAFQVQSETFEIYDGFASQYQLKNGYIR